MENYFSQEPEQRKVKPEPGWEVPPAEETKELAVRAENKIEEIYRVLKGKRPSEKQKKEIRPLISEILSPEAMRGLIIRRGEDNKNLHVLKNSLDLLALTVFGKDNFLNLEENEAIQALDKMGIEKIALNELFATFFHFGDKQNAQKVLKIIENYRKEIGSPEIFLRGMMDKGSFLIKEGEPMEENILEEYKRQAQKEGLPILAAKIGYGKMLIEGQKIKEARAKFQELAGTFLELGDMVDFLRAQAEQGMLALQLAQRQSEQAGNRLTTLKEAKNIASAIIKRAKKIDYPVAFIYGHFIRAMANWQTVQTIKRKYGEKVDRSKYSEADLKTIEATEEKFEQEKTTVERLIKIYQYRPPKLSGAYGELEDLAN